MIKFLKMHGLGNDFAIFNKQEIFNIKDLELFSRSISCRNSGIGCDQVIIYDLIENYVSMEIYNADGSKALACGNATRCVVYIAKYIHGIKSNIIEVRTANRRLPCEVIGKEVKVNAGSASFDESWMPKKEDLWKLFDQFKVSAREILCVDVGNPHLVIFAEYLTEKDMEVLGHRFEVCNIFPNGVNVNFAHVKETDIALSVWERGTGLTLACGSGACATYAAAHKLGFVEGSCNIIFKLGKLKISYKENSIIVQGPATLVYEGSLNYA